MTLARLFSRCLSTPCLSRLARCQSTASCSSTPIEKIIIDNIKVSFIPQPQVLVYHHPPPRMLKKKSTGPISVAMYMRLCLSHPTHGYYMNASNHVFGYQGDYITSPEMSQVFGEVHSYFLFVQHKPHKIYPSSSLEYGSCRNGHMPVVLRI